MDKKSKTVAVHGASLRLNETMFNAGESTGQLTSEVLLGGRDVLAIHHHGERYILRLTRAGKLILTK